jgi:hypothetical protein
LRVAGNAPPESRRRHAPFNGSKALGDAVRFFIVAPGIGEGRSDERPSLFASAERG